MSFAYYKDEVAEKSCGCGNQGHDEDCKRYQYEDCGREDREKYSDNDRCERDNWNKEFLGKSVSECKYYRVCKKRYYEPEKKCCHDRHECCCCKN